MVSSAIIALLTDFGWDDYFVGVLKGVITSINPQARIIDISHGVTSFKIQEGAFQLLASYRFFPRGTIFLSVVDPGVGSARRILLAQSEKYFFVSPDNGLLTYVLSQEKSVTLYEVRNPKYFITSFSSTFEARDKMAPVAAWLSLGIDPQEIGPRINKYQRLAYQEPSQSLWKLKGQVIYIDKFGNAITDLKGCWLDELISKSQIKDVFMRIKNKKISGYYSTYSAAPFGEAFFLIGSHGLIEVFMREDSAAQKLGIEVGDKVVIMLSRNKDNKKINK